MTDQGAPHPYGLPEAVTFDFWNTLVVPEEHGSVRDRRAGAWLGLLEGAGFAAERERLHAVFQDVWEAYNVSWKANEQFDAARAAEHALDQLGYDVPDDLRTQLADSFASPGTATGENLQLAEGVAELLRRLKGMGLGLGIVCDVGFTPSPVLREQLAHNGVLELFDHWSFSDEVGAYKPSPVIFRHALTGLGGLAAHAVAHVGDLRRTDIAGARAMGMTAVRYTGVYDDDSAEEPEGHHVITSHADLPAALGL